MERYLVSEKTKQDIQSMQKEEAFTDNSEFYDRWYAKFGKPQPRTMSIQEFMKRLREMRDFE